MTPKPTTDLAQQRSDLTEHGYCLVADALDADTVATVRNRIVEQAAAEREAGIARTNAAPNQVVGNLLNKGKEFWPLMTHPVIDDLIGWLIGPDIIASSVIAPIVCEGGTPGPIHTDQGYVDIPIAEAMVGNVMWMLTDFTTANGGTQFLPGSQNTIRINGAPYDADALRSAEGPAGTAFVFDGRLVHRTGINTTPDPRIGMLTYWVKPWIRQQENMALSLSDETVAEMPEELRRRVGFEVYRSLGGVDPGQHRDEFLVDRNVERTGRLESDQHGATG